MRRGVLAVAGLVAVILAGLFSSVLGQVAKLDGTSTTQFAIRANGATPTTMMAGGSGELVLPNGLTVVGPVDWSEAAVSDLGCVATADIDGGTIDGAEIGGDSPGSGDFNWLGATTADIDGGWIDATDIGQSFPAPGTFTSLAATTTVNFGVATVSNLGSVTTADINGGTIDGTAIGSSTPSSGKFTTVSASGQITSTVANGTAPLVIESTTVVSNLNASRIQGLYPVGTWGNGGMPYVANGPSVSCSAAGVAGQFLKSGGSTAGSCAPTWTGLMPGYIFVGNASSIPTGMVMSGDATLNSSGELHLSVNSVTANEIVNGQVAEAEIGTGAVTEAKIGTGAVTAEKIGAGAVTEGKIGTGAVTAGKLPTALQDAILLAGIEVSGEDGDTINVTLTVTDAAGNSLSRPVFVPWVISDSQWSAAETSRSVTTTVTAGSDWGTVTANKKGYVFSTNTGGIILGVYLSGDYTVYAHYVVAGQVFVATLNFN